MSSVFFHIFLRLRASSLPLSALNPEFTFEVFPIPSPEGQPSSSKRSTGNVRLQFPVALHPLRTCVLVQTLGISGTTSDISSKPNGIQRVLTPTPTTTAPPNVEVTVALRAAALDATLLAQKICSLLQCFAVLFETLCAQSSPISGTPSLWPQRNHPILR